MSSLVIADKFQCPKMDGKYSKEHKKLIRKGAKVTQEYVDRVNEEDNGLFYVVDHEATKLNHKQRSKKGMIKTMPKVHVVSASDTGKGDEESKVPNLKDLRLQYPNIKATSVDAFLAKVAELENAPSEGARMTNPPIED